ncbi:DUF6138 family protein [Enterocloster clostridioformis]|uniref:Uncharacterized protein n=1 Tax=Enterocloster clostridioformis TaxID=1531 RepID=A0A174F491_9FIRM|nr:DUF6138 family protein [Enterocloster clostridioformis]CUO43130.1 Uncharacterised protein [Enterocloster clostridioformis]
MSLPKRDGVHDRYYLIHKPDTSPEVLAEADLCIQDVLNGTARENHSAYLTVVRNHNGTPFLPDQLLERYLTGLPLKGFPCEDAVSLCDAMRRLVGWQEIRYKLEKYIEQQVQERFFLVGERDDGFTVFPPCTVWPELRPEDVDEGLLHFACYVAVCHTVYGQSFESLTTEHILGLVSQIRPDMVKELKTNGSGKLPPNIQKRKTKHLTASANDAFATIRITARDCTEGCCDEALSYLVEVLEQPEFPRSYSIEFRGPEKIYLPIPGLPKKGVHQLFACAVRYPRLHVRMENYARLAMQEDEWYNNLSDESCAMPGTFAVFALGLEGPKWWRLVCDYLDRCDDEHSSLQEKFIHAFFKKYGFTAQSLPVLVHGVQSMQNLKPAKEFRTLIANEESLDALLEIKGHLEYYLAVFALGLEGPKWWRLVCDYMNRCDDEHSSLQEKFIHTFFKQYGFTAQSLPVLVHGVQSMQNLEPAKEFCTLIANKESLDAQLEIKGQLEYYLSEESGSNKRALDYLWRDVLWAIWGKDSENGGSKVIKSAPKELKEKYQQVFA